MEGIKIFNKETMSSLQIAEITGKQEVSVINHSNFMGQKVDVYGTAEEPLFLAKDVATWIGHSDVSTMMRNLDNEEKVTNIVCTPGGKQNAWFLTEDGLYEVLMQSRKPIAKQFKKGVKEILKSIRRTGEFKARPAANATPTVAEKMKAASWAARFLNLSDCSKLAIAKSILGDYGLPLPEYVPSKGVLKSATELLQEKGIPMSVLEFNRKAVEEGFLCVNERNSARGKKKFKTITKKGTPFGENQVSPKNPGETQPKWYAEKFNELAEAMGITVKSEAL